MDTQRYFPNPIESGGEPAIPSKKGQQSEPSHVWLSTARSLMEKCLQESVGQSSLGSLYVGTLGPQVYLKWRMAHLLDDNSAKQRLLIDALLIVQKQLRVYEPDLNENPFQNSNHSPNHHRRVSLLEGPYVGCKALSAVINYDLKEINYAQKQARGLIENIHKACLQLPEDKCEVLYGRAGALQTIFFLREGLHDDRLGSSEALAIARAILRQGREVAEHRRRDLSPKEPDLSLLWVWHYSYYMGAAHGVAGILQMLLSLHPDELQELEKKDRCLTLIRKTLQELSSFCLPSGNLDSSIHTRAKKDRLVHWCHGATGHVLLLLKAAQVFQDDTYWKRAREIALEVIWTRGLLKKGTGLCHGIAGNAYALLAIGRRDETFQAKAQSFAKFALSHLEELELVPDRPYSLYEGLSGLCCLTMDLASPSQARFPLYEFA